MLTGRIVFNSVEFLETRKISCRSSKSPGPAENRVVLPVAMNARFPVVSQVFSFLASVSGASSLVRKWIHQFFFDEIRKIIRFVTRFFYGIQLPSRQRFLESSTFGLNFSIKMSNHFFFLLINRHFYAFVIFTSGSREKSKFRRNGRLFLWIFSRDGITFLFFFLLQKRPFQVRHHQEKYKNLKE